MINWTFSKWNTFELLLKHIYSSLSEYSSNNMFRSRAILLPRSHGRSTAVPSHWTAENSPWRYGSGSGTDEKKCIVTLQFQVVHRVLILFWILKLIKYLKEDNSLLIHKPSRITAGHYVCSAVNSAGEDKYDYTLSVRIWMLEHGSLRFFWTVFTVAP